MAVGALVLAMVPMASTASVPHRRSDVAASQRAPVPVPPHPYRDCTNTDGRSKASGLPPIPCYPNPFGTGESVVFDYGGRLADGETVARRIKTRLVIPAVVFRGQIAVCFSFATKAACPLQLKFPREDPTVTYAYYGIAGQVFVRSPPGSDVEYGVFPPITVHTLAFGSLPVTAQVELRQPLTNKGFAKPLQLSWFTSAGAVTVGKRIPGYEGYGPAPPFASGQIYWNPPPDISGPVTVTVKSLAVDGRRVDVGPRCHSTATLSLTARGGFYESTGTTPGNGRPGEYSPLGQGNSYLHGLVDIPAFAGCGSSNENLNPLISSFVSGHDNLVNVVQDGPIEIFCAKYPTDRTCPTQPAAVRRLIDRLPARVMDPRTRRALTAAPRHRSA